MSNPSFDNIDKWLFEYTEGNLSSQQVDQLKQFLLHNPELEMDLDAWESARVEAVPVVFPNVDSYTKRPVAWVFPTVILATFGVSLALGWLTYNEIKNAAHVESVARVNEINYVKKINEVKSSKSAVQQNKVSSVTTTIESFLATEKSSPYSRASQMDFAIETGIASLNKKEKLSGRSLEVLKSIEAKHKEETLLAETEESEGMEVFEIEKKSNLSKNNTTTNIPEKAEDNSEAIEESIETAKAMSRSHDRISSNYNKSFSSKVKSTIRKIVRMTDNPIGLTNSKDIYYHTPGMQTLDVNFGTVGSLLQPRLQTVSRAQWTGHGNQQVANQISFDTYVKDIRGGIGVQLNHVYYGKGAYQVGQFALIYSPKFSLSKNVVIEPAIRFKMGNKRVFNQKLVPGQMVEIDRRNEGLYSSEVVNSSTQDLWYKDVGFALMSNTKWFSAGVQIDNIGKHYSNVFENSDKNDYAGRHITATIGTDYVSRSKLFSFSPYIMYQKMENLSEIWGGSNFRYKNFILGGGISSLGDYAGSIGLKSKRLMITYGIDNTYSVLLDKKLLSQQLTLRILTNRGSNSHRMLK
jgi:hypothetical protein